MATAISYFNPCADFRATEEFKQLKRGNKVTVVIITILASFFFIIGGVAAFRWTVRHYNKDSNRAIKVAVAVPYRAPQEDNEQIRKAEADIQAEQQKLNRETAERKAEVRRDLAEWEAGLTRKLDADPIATTT